VITKAAVKLGDDVYTGLRHPQIIHHVVWIGVADYVHQGEQGFVTDDGEFLDRMAASQHAVASGQVKERSSPWPLLSEEVW